MKISEMQQRAFDNACAKGFHDDPTYKLVAVQAALMMSEVGELVEADRKDDRLNLKEEAADIAIRLGDFCGLFDIDLEQAIEEKMAYNESRPKMHGGKKY